MRGLIYVCCIQALKMVTTLLSATTHVEIAAQEPIFLNTRNVPPRYMGPTCKSLRLKTTCL